jgi:hypothetical protein
MHESLCWKAELLSTFSREMRSLSILILVALTRAAAGQTVPWAAPSLRIVDSIRIDPKKENLNGRELPMALRADGSIAILGYGPELFYFDSTGRRKWKRQLWPDLRYPNALVWKRDSIIVIDNAADQILAVGSNGGVGDLIEFPDYVRPTFKNRRTLAAYGAFDVATVIDSTLIGTGRRPHRLVVYGPNTKSEPNRLPVLRANYDGIVQTSLGTVVNAPRGDVWTILQDGRLIVFHDDKDSLAFIAVSPRGDTIFSRHLPKLRAVFGNAVGGTDGTIWVSGSIGGVEFHHTVFDARGNALGRFTTPNYFRIGAGDARHVWIYDTRGANRPLTRYTVLP